MHLSDLPPLGALLRVIPVAQTHWCGTLAITLVTIEVHVQGWLATMQFDLPEEATEARFTLHSGVLPASRHRGGNIQWHPSARYAMYGNEPRSFVYYFSPALDAHLTTFHLWLRDIYLIGKSPGGADMLVRQIPGLSVFTVERDAGRPTTILPGAIDAAEYFDQVAPVIREGIDQGTAERVRHAQSDAQARLREDILQVIYRYDPIGIGWGIDNPHGADEYDLEVGTILPRLSEALSEADVQRIVHEEFVQWYDRRTAGNEESYREIAQDIWAIWQRR